MSFFSGMHAARMVDHVTKHKNLTLLFWNYAKQLQLPIIPIEMPAYCVCP